MKIIEEVAITNHIEIHQKNVVKIKKVLAELLNAKYKSCEEKIRYIVITNNISEARKKYNHPDLREIARATTCKSGEKSDIIINYNNCILDASNNYALDFFTTNFICHEFQHVRDRVKYDGFINEYCSKHEISYNQGVIGEMIFKEFNAQFQGQYYCPLIWEFNKYNLEENIKKYHIMFSELKEQIEQIKSLQEARLELEEIAQNALDFTRNLMYDLSLAFGCNAADNKREQGKKYININIQGIDDGIDEILNNFTKGFNFNISDNKALIEYSIKHSMMVHDFINEIFKDKLKRLN